MRRDGPGPEAPIPSEVGLIVRGAEGTGPKGARFDNFVANPAPGSVVTDLQPSD